MVGDVRVGEIAPDIDRANGEETPDAVSSAPTVSDAPPRAGIPLRYSPFSPRPVSSQPRRCCRKCTSKLELQAPIPTTGRVERVAGSARAVVELHEHAPGRSNPRASARVACFGAHAGRIRARKRLFPIVCILANVWRVACVGNRVQRGFGYRAHPSPTPSLRVPCCSPDTSPSRCAAPRGRSSPPREAPPHASPRSCPDAATATPEASPSPSGPSATRRRRSPSGASRAAPSSPTPPGTSLRILSVTCTHL